MGAALNVSYVSPELWLKLRHSWLSKDCVVELWVTAALVA